VLGVRVHEGGRELSTFLWGLLPAWWDDPKTAARAFNARAESVATKPLFRQAFRRRRLLVPVDGFYEWAALPSSRRKQPYYFKRGDGDPVVLAGLWEYWARGDGRRRTATILTTRAGPDMPVHDRQPVVLEAAEWEPWLDSATDPEMLLRGLLEPRGGVLEHHPVSPDVGSVNNDGPYLVEPAVALPGAFD
jgi:putative SOS response-associated peptidase YedK